jgi:hypothetical protein
LPSRADMAEEGIRGEKVKVYLHDVTFDHHQSLNIQFTRVIWLVFYWTCPCEISCPIHMSHVTNVPTRFLLDFEIVWELLICHDCPWNISNPLRLRSRNRAAVVQIISSLKNWSKVWLALALVPFDMLVAHVMRASQHVCDWTAQHLFHAHRTYSRWVEGTLLFPIDL